MEGVVICLLTAISFLAFLGLRHAVRMLPILPFEVTWKVIGIAADAIPHLIAPGHERRNPRGCCSAVPSSSSLIAVIPWGYVWRRYARSPADPWG